MADGSLRFDTRIDTGGFDAGISTLATAVEKLSGEIGNLSESIAQHFNGAGAAAATASRDVGTVGDAAERAEEQVRSLQEQMDAISVHTMQDGAADAADAAPVRAPASEESLNYDPEAVAAVFGEAAAQIQNYEQAVAEYGNQAGMAMNGLAQEAARAETAITAAAGDGAEEVERTSTSMKDYVLNALRSAMSALGNIPAAAARGLSRIPGIARNAFSAAARAATGFAKALGSRLASSAKKAVQNLMGVGKASNSVSKSILKLSNMFKLMLLRMAMQAAIRGVKEGMENLVQYSDSANRSMSSLMSGMTYLKNSFAAAFAPILSVVAPILITLINLLATAINYVNQLFAALGGTSTFIRAKKVNQDYAKSLKATGGAAKKAGKDAKKALADFDDLTLLQKDSSGGGGGGGAGAGGMDMFETAVISDSISDFANQLKGLIGAGDWAGVGKLIGEKINGAVQGFTEHISWDNVGARITGFLTAFTTMFNSLTGTIDWYSIGIMMGTGINTLANTLYLLLTQIDWQLLGSAFALGLNGMAHTINWDMFGRTIGAYFQAKIAALYGFAETFDWASVGLSIGTGLNRVIGEIDWAMLGLAFSTGLGGIFAVAGHFATTFDWTGFGSSLALSLSTFFQTFDWAGSGTAISDTVIGFLNALVAFIAETDWWAFGDGVATALENIDWATVASRLFMAIGAALGGLAAFLGGLISNGVTAAKEYFQEKIELCGGNIVDGILTGILHGIAGIAIWIYDNVFSPFIDGFKAAFGIHSPSTVMADMGEYIWDGFCNGIKKFFKDPVGFIKQHITDPFVNGIKGLLGIHSPSTVLEAVGGDTVSGFNSGVEKGQTSSEGVIKSWASGVAGWFAEKLGISSSSESKESKAWADSTISGYNNTVSQNYTKSQAVMEKWADSIRMWFTGSGESKGVNEAAWKKFADGIMKAFASGVQSGNGSTRSPMESWAKSTKDWFWGASYTGGTNGLYQEFYQMAKLVNQGFANGIGAFSHLAQNAVRKWGQEVVASAKGELDIHSPSRVAYSIARYFVEGFNNGLLAMLGSSVGAAEKWLGSVTGVFDGIEIGVPVGLDIPNAASYLPRMASGSTVPPRAGEFSAKYAGKYQAEEGQDGLLASISQMLKDFKGQRPEGGEIHLTVNLDGKAVYDNVVARNRKEKERTKKNPLLA